MTTQKPVDCKDFREQLYAFEADEVEEDRRLELQAHLDRCPGCARRFEVEGSWTRVLRLRLGLLAPAGLRSRVLAALEGEAPDRRGGVLSWLLAPGAAATMAAVLLAVVLSPVLLDIARTPALAGDAVHVIRTVTVVDVECDRAGRSPEEQRRCRHDRHLNALKVSDRTYWSLGMAQAAAREIALDPSLRGQRIVVEGDFFPGLSTLRLTGFRETGRVTL